MIGIEPPFICRCTLPVAVILRGHRSHNKVNDKGVEYYNMGDLFVCTSQWQEPLARVHYEAMASALPIITTNRGGNAEVINEGVNGFAIDDYTNPDEFSKYIKYLIKNEEKGIEMGKAGREFVEKNHNWDIIANRLLKLFDSVEKKYK